MDISPDVRAAVLAAECAANGHVMDVSQAIRDNPDEAPERSTIRVMAREGDTLPHLFCRRCGWVWLIVADGASYDAAEDNLNGLLAPKNRRKLRRERRQERAAAAAERARLAAAAPPVVEPVPVSVPAAAAAPTPAPDA